MSSTSAVEATIIDTDLPDVADINKSARCSDYMNAFAQGRADSEGKEARMIKKKSSNLVKRSGREGKDYILVRGGRCGYDWMEEDRRRR